MTRCWVAVVGGAGALGRGLAYRFARHGYDVVIGSRSTVTATAVVDAISTRLPGESGGSITQATNESACASADIVVLATPFEVHDSLLPKLSLAGKIVVSCMNPLTVDECGIHFRPVQQGHSSAAEAAQHVVPDARVVAAFHHLSAGRLWSGADLLDEDVLVAGDDHQAKAAVMSLIVSLTGRPGIDAGGLELARHLESFTAVLISINRRHRDHVGFRMTGLDRPTDQGPIHSPVLPINVSSDRSCPRRARAP